MALNAGAYPVDGDVYDLGLSPSSYTSGGTLLGANGSARAVQFEHDVEMRRKQSRGAGTIIRSGRILGTNVVLEMILLNRSDAVMDLMFQQRASGDTYGGDTSYKYGHLIEAGDAQTTALQIRATDNTKPSLLIPAALCVSVAPIAWQREGKHLDAAVLTVVPLFYPSLGDCVFYGDPADWPSLPWS